MRVRRANIRNRVRDIAFLVKDGPLVADLACFQVCFVTFLLAVSEHAETLTEPLARRVSRSGYGDAINVGSPEAMVSALAAAADASHTTALRFHAHHTSDPPRPFGCD
ncbi:MAG: hypothetical protein H0X66_03345 [Verrucomicrobia bacterium]|nr:hypothetical protein [Verrucomicrobiota bacterium]